MATETIAVPKSIVGDILKFDKVQYEAARDALANLVSIEAEGIKEGHNELVSISHLLESISHLQMWYSGEEAEGETMEESIELAADGAEDLIVAEKAANKMMPNKGESLAEFKARCKEAGMDDDYAKECFTKYMAAEEDKEKSATMDKCLECGCHRPEETHGQSDVTTADMVAPSETPKSAEADEVVAEEATEEVTEEVTPDNSTEDNSEDLNAIVEQVVESATKALKSEIALLVSAKEAAQAKAVGLETELAQAKSLAVAGGPKRTARPLGGTSNELVLKAATYKAKANAATDPDLAKGYRALADKFYAEATDTLNK